MSDERRVDLVRDGALRMTATNSRGRTLTMGSGDGDDFTPVELLLAAIAGCTAMDVDAIVAKRAEPESFAVSVRADKVRDRDGNHLSGIEVVFDVVFPEGEAGDAARTVLPVAITKSHDRLCTVSRTVELGTPIDTH